MSNTGKPYVKHRRGPDQTYVKHRRKYVKHRKKYVKRRNGGTGLWISFKLSTNIFCYDSCIGNRVEQGMGTLDALARARRLQEQATGVKEVQRMLDFWGDDLRGIAKCLANSALFSVRDKRAPRRKYDREIIASLNDVTVKYTGTQLDQDDHLVFMQLLHLARTLPLGEPVVVTAAQMLSDDALGWSDSKEAYARLRESLARMLEGTVWVEDHQPDRTRKYGSHLINTLVRDPIGTDTMWTVYLDHTLANLMTGDELTLINWVRQRRMSALAQWLHSHYATHNPPLPYKAETIYALCGSKLANQATFRQQLKKALEELKKEKFIECYEVGPRPSFLVSVKRQFDA